MYNLFKIAIRNLMRYRRRTILTASLIAIGVIFVLVFVSVSGSFKNMIIGQITGSMLGDMEIHRKGYVASIDNLPLTLMMNPQQAEQSGGGYQDDPGDRGLLPSDKVWRAVQQLYRDDQHTAQRGLSRHGDEDPAASYLKNH